MARNYVCHEVLAEDCEDFQEYVYKDGTRVPKDTLVGFELSFNGEEPELYLLEDIYFADEPFNDM